jgi:hypothetical protein
MNRRLLLHEALCNILECPSTGSNCRAYFQPPATVHMKYPAIVYSLESIDGVHADDTNYLANKRYSLTLISSDPDTSLVDAIMKLQTARFDRAYTSDNLNHYIFEVYY